MYKCVLLINLHKIFMSKTLSIASEVKCLSVDLSEHSMKLDGKRQGR